MRKRKELNKLNLYSKMRKEFLISTYRDEIFKNVNITVGYSEESG
jgi:hypothetical protein